MAGYEQTKPSTVDSAVKVLVLAQEVASRQARRLASTDEVRLTRQLVLDTLRLLNQLETVARRYLEPSELSDLIRVKRMCRCYDLILWDTAPEFRRSV